MFETIFFGTGRFCIDHCGQWWPLVMIAAFTAYALAALIGYAAAISTAEKLSAECQNRKIGRAIALTWNTAMLTFIGLYLFWLGAALTFTVLVQNHRYTDPMLDWSSVAHWMGGIGTIVAICAVLITLHGLEDHNSKCLIPVPPAEQTGKIEIIYEWIKKVTGKVGDGIAFSMAGLMCLVIYGIGAYILFWLVASAWVIVPTKVICSIYWLVYRQWPVEWPIMTAITLVLVGLYACIISMRGDSYNRPSDWLVEVGFSSALLLGAYIIAPFILAPIAGVIILIAGGIMSII